MIYLLWLVVSLVFLAWCASTPSSSLVAGAFSVPGFPVVGNAIQLYHNPSAVLARWAQIYKNPVLLVKLGSTPVLVINDYHHAYNLFTKHSIALGSRPLLFTFHKVVSAVQGLTVGSTPAGASFQRKKKAISQHLSRSQLQSSMVADILDRHACLALKPLLAESLRGTHNCRTELNDVSMLLPAQHFVLGVAIDLTYGRTLNCNCLDRDLAADIIATEAHIIRSRALISNYQDYLPWLKRWPFRWFLTRDARRWRDRRDRYMRALYDDFQCRMHDNDLEAGRCMMAQILSSKLNVLTSAELQSVCLTMVSAGLDNGALTFNHIMGQFSYRNGYRLQEELHRSLVDLYKNDVLGAWKLASVSMECDFALAIILEALRYFTVLPLGLPRLTTKAFTYNGLAIPANHIVVLNAYAANHDPEQFTQPYSFDPHRWLDNNGKLKPSCQIMHLTFGLGSRKCSGEHLALQEIYTLLCRTVLLFRIRRPTNGQYLMELDPFAGNANPTATSFEPAEFRVWLRPREGSERLHTIIFK